MITFGFDSFRTTTELAELHSGARLTRSEGRPLHELSVLLGDSYLPLLARGEVMHALPTLARALYVDRNS